MGRSDSFTRRHLDTKSARTPSPRHLRTWSANCSAPFDMLSATSDGFLATKALLFVAMANAVRPRDQMSMELLMGASPMYSGEMYDMVPMRGTKGLPWGMEHSKSMMRGVWPNMTTFSILRSPWTHPFSWMWQSPLVIPHMTDLTSTAAPLSIASKRSQAPLSKVSSIEDASLPLMEITFSWFPRASMHLTDLAYLFSDAKVFLTASPEETTVLFARGSI